MIHISAYPRPPNPSLLAVTERPPSSSPQGSSVLTSFRARDFYDNWITDERWSGDTFHAWSYASAANATAAADVFDEGNGSFTVVFDALEEAGGTTFLFVERNELGIPGSPFEVRKPRRVVPCCGRRRTDGCATEHPKGDANREGRVGTGEKPVLTERNFATNSFFAW